jgi:phosphatidylglycerophosphate synthase
VHFQEHSDHNTPNVDSLDRSFDDPNSVSLPDSGDVVEKTYSDFRSRYERLLSPVIRFLFAKIHANVVTVLRAVPGLAAAGLMCMNESQFSKTFGEYVSQQTAAISLFGAHLIGDGIDGMTAREKNECTVEGARLDPLMDKCVNDAVMAIMALTTSDIAVTLACSANIVLDIFSQRMRGPLIKQVRDAVRSVLHPDTCEKSDSKLAGGANVYGKVKFGLQSAGIISFIAGFTSVAIPLLAVAFASGLVGVLKRRK